jgi:hypothetical protein
MFWSWCCAVDTILGRDTKVFARGSSHRQLELCIRISLLCKGLHQAAKRVRPQRAHQTLKDSKSSQYAKSWHMSIIDDQVADVASIRVKLLWPSLLEAADQECFDRREVCALEGSAIRLCCLALINLQDAKAVNTQEINSIQWDGTQ